MDLRIFTEPQQGATYEDLLRVATATEVLGFDAFFRSDHYLRIGGGDPGAGPSDAWLTLAALARETSRIRLGTLVTPTTFRLPGPLAISAAQVDRMSGGRVELGLGAGWNAREHAAYGIPFPETGERFDRFVEQVEVIDGLLRTPEGATYSFTGEHHTVVDSPALPKPVQSPRPPIILGGLGKSRSAALTARFADEFNVAFRSVEETNEIFGRVRAAVDPTGRDVVYSVAQVLCVGRDEGEIARRAAAIGREVDELRENGLAGTPAEVVDRIGRFVETTGTTRLYLQVLDLGDLEHLELVAAEVARQVG
ncbi:MAG TPA: LLM class F420-dependent oxidoreductase [Jatrophihabitans sp.]|uniref:LLM class F420-dependent oxidoreductase n=1 Tax=Jatrophihabitans sp. TaxID=1932789 RepID=UPI002E046A82|nr:LLM class F420-dependent oxidoreductase [Jatrophihabitans sp.]